MGVNKDRGRYLLPGCYTVKRRCNLCLQSKDHLKTDKYNNTVTLCYSCQDIITKVVKENWISTGHKTALEYAD